MSVGAAVSEAAVLAAAEVTDSASDSVVDAAVVVVVVVAAFAVALELAVLAAVETVPDGLYPCQQCMSWGSHARYSRHKGGAKIVGDGQEQLVVLARGDADLVLFVVLVGEAMGGPRVENGALVLGTLCALVADARRQVMPGGAGRRAEAVVELAGGDGAVARGFDFVQAFLARVGPDVAKDTVVCGSGEADGEEKRHGNGKAHYQSKYSYHRDKVSGGYST